MAGNETFSIVMRGYKKEEVLSYISGLSEQMQQLKNDLDRKDVEINRLKRELAEVESVPAGPTEETLESIRSEIKAETEAEYLPVIDDLKAKLESKEAELESLKQAAVQNDSEELEKKAKEYDECKAALADLMIEARRNADDVVAQANARADMLRSKSEAEFMTLGSSFAVLQNNVADIKLKLQDNLQQISLQIEQFENKLFELQKDVDETVQNAEPSPSNNE